MTDIIRSISLDKSQVLFSTRAAWYYPTKRLLDIALSIILLIIFSPLMALISLLIKLDSNGPVLFRQKRIGSRRVRKDHGWTWEVGEFTCLKFRTMFYNTDPSLHRTYVTALINNDQKKMEELQEGNQAIRKLVNDPRITRIGHKLRKYSLDELPQFLNVLVGNMSLVGPRPPIDYEVEMYQPWHKERLKATPGLTGLQQIKARCTVDFDDQVKFDLDYIAKQSLWLDLKIMVMTPYVVMRHRGAC